jgi:hypothetical protein
VSGKQIYGKIEELLNEEPVLREEFNMLNRELEILDVKDFSVEKYNKLVDEFEDFLYNLTKLVKLPKKKRYLSF